MMFEFILLVLTAFFIGMAVGIQLCQYLSQEI